MHVTSRGLMQSEKISLYTPSGSLDLRWFCHEIFTLNQKLAQIVVHTQWIISIYWTPTKLNGSRNWLALQIELLTKVNGSPNWMVHFQIEWRTIERPAKLNGSLLNGSPYWIAHRTEWLTIKWKAGSNARSLVHTRRQPPASTTISSARINFGWHWNFMTSASIFFPRQVNREYHFFIF